MHNKHNRDEQKAVTAEEESTDEADALSDFVVPRD